MTLEPWHVPPLIALERMPTEAVLAKRNAWVAYGSLANDASLLGFAINPKTATNMFTFNAFIIAASASGSYGVVASPSVTVTSTTLTPGRVNGSTFCLIYCRPTDVNVPPFG